LNKIKNENIEKRLIIYSVQGRKEARKEGRKEGKKEGMKEGQEEGIQ